MAEGRRNDTAKFRGVIVREIEEIKSRLDGLARKDLLASISWAFLRKELSCCTIIEQQPQNKAANGSANAETFSLAKEVKSLRLLA